jgi:hypothetical protein
VGSVASATSVHTFCVLKADVCGFGGLMHAGADGPVRKALSDAVRLWTRKAIATETASGDSLMMIHDDPVALAQTARHIMDEVYQATGQPRLRMALHYGEVTVHPGADDAPTIAGGSAICARRAWTPCITRSDLGYQRVPRALATGRRYGTTALLLLTVAALQRQLGQDEPDLGSSSSSWSSKRPPPHRERAPRSRSTAHSRLGSCHQPPPNA